MLNDPNGTEPTEGTPEPDATSTGTEGTDATLDTSKTAEGNGAPDAPAAPEPPLTDTENARLQELLDASSKENNDIRSQHGREQKSWDQKEAEYLAIIDNLSKREGTPGAPTEPSTDEPNFYTPTQPFENEDGTLNLDALGEWNYASNQRFAHQLKDIEKQLNAVGISLKDIETTRETSQEVKTWESQGYNEETYTEFKAIERSQGSLAAHEYLKLKDKQQAGIKAAEAHQAQQRGAPLSSGMPPPSVSDAEASAEAIAKEIQAMPYGAERTQKVSSLFNQYPTAIASEIIKRVAQS